MDEATKDLLISGAIAWALYVLVSLPQTYLMVTEPVARAVSGLVSSVGSRRSRSRSRRGRRGVLAGPAGCPKPLGIALHSLVFFGLYVLSMWGYGQWKAQQGTTAMRR
jgi:hypothetical protein